MQQQAAQTLIATVMRTHTSWVTAQQSVHELLALFVDKGISAVPVVDDDCRPVGFVSKTDVVRHLHRASPEERQESEVSLQPWWDATRVSQMQVGDIMTPAVYTFTPATTVADAMAVMAFEGLHHLPVVEDSGKLVGMVSALDVLDWMARCAGYTPADGKQGRIFEPPA
jgi:CBS domain-containing membrane protein